jgi:hypothetical protein
MLWRMVSYPIRANHVAIRFREEIGNGPRIVLKNALSRMGPPAREIRACENTNTGPVNFLHPTALNRMISMPFIFQHRNHPASMALLLR